jgi:hypothetical protein
MVLSVPVVLKKNRGSRQKPRDSSSSNNTGDAKSKGNDSGGDSVDDNGINNGGSTSKQTIKLAKSTPKNHNPDHTY